MLTRHFQLVPRSGKRGSFCPLSIRFHRLVLNFISTGSTLSYIYIYITYEYVYRSQQYVTVLLRNNVLLAPVLLRSNVSLLYCFFLSPFYLQAVQIHSANGVKLLEA
jgi:hypothetical protein